MRIVYVEDNATNVILVQRVAGMGKHQVIHYDTGQEALDHIDQAKPDLILLDVQLRGALTGLDVAQKLREKGCILPIIAVTAYAMKGDRQRCLEAGCDDYLAKPVSVAELVTVFKRYGDAVAAGKPILSTSAPTVAVTVPVKPETTPASVEPLPVVITIPAVEEVKPSPSVNSEEKPTPEISERKTDLPTASVAAVIPTIAVPVVDAPAIIPSTDLVVQQTPTPVNAEP